MSLNFDLTGIENYKELCWEPTHRGGDRLNPITETLVFAAQIVGVADINDKTKGEFFRRLSMLEHVGGSFVQKSTPKGSVMLYITRKDVDAHVGLKTNADIKTKTQFNKVIIRTVEQDTQCAVNRRES